MYGSQSFAESSFASEMESSVVKTQGASWSRAAPFEKDLYKYNISDKIGSHNTPTAANLSVGAGVGGRVRNRRPAPTGQASPIPRPRPEVSLSLDRQSPPDEMSDMDAAEMGDEEMERYYSYIMNGMDDRETAPIKQDWLNTVMGSLPIWLAHTAESDSALVDRLATEIETDYLLSMRKSVVDYVLRRPAEMERLGVTAIPPTEAEKVKRPPIDSAEWRESFFAVSDHMHGSLHTCNVAMVEILDAWVNYEGLSLVADSSGVFAPESAAGLPVELESFRKTLSEHRERVKRTLTDEWFGELVERFHNNRSAFMEGPTQNDLERFFESVACLMANQTRALTTKSIDQMVEFFSRFKLDGKPQGPVSAEEVEAAGEAAHAGTVESKLLPKAALRASVVYQNGAVEITPSFGEIERHVLDLFDRLVLCLSDIPRVESKLFSSTKGRFCVPSVKPDEAWVETARSSIRQVIQENVAAPNALVEQYAEFEFLLNGEADRTVDTLLSKPRQLSDYDGEINRLRDAAAAAAAKVGFPGKEQACHLTLVEVHCAEINESIQKKATMLADKILEQMATDNRKSNDLICQQFLAIRKQLREVPTDTEELVDFMAMAESYRKNDVPKLKLDCRRSWERLDFLLKNHHILPDDDRALIHQTYTWVDRIMPEFEKTEDKLRDDRDKFEEDLRNRLEKFQEEMSAIHDEVLALREEGCAPLDLKVVKQQVEKCSDIRDRFDAAIDKGIAMNEEEEHLGWVKTTFTDIVEGGQDLAPIAKLWGLTNDFLTNLGQWNTGSFQKLKAEDIKNEVDQTFRDMKSLTRSFGGENGLPA
eukprot:COSAG06_NODE_2238_length_7273_cov_4.879147_5_plen_818_part_01